MDAASAPHRRVRCVHAAWLPALTTVAMMAAAVADDQAPAPPPFQPGEISIGEPIALPFGGEGTRESPAPAPPGAGVPAPVSAPVDDPRSALPPRPSVEASVPGSGWLGLAVAESPVPGRWRVEDVTAGGPAARAGIAVGDELRAVNGVSLESADQVSQALTAVAAGQDVRVAVARADQVSDVVLRAESRPAPRPAEPQRFAAQPAASPLPAAAAPATPTPVVTAPPQPAAGPATVPPSDRTTSSTALPSAREWQASPAHEPAPAATPAARFGGPAAASAPHAAAPRAPGSMPSAGRTALGVRTVPIDPATQARFHLPAPSGAYVIGVVQDLPAAKAGVPPGSVIVALGERPVRSPLELTQLVTGGPLDRPVTVQYVLPGGEAKQAAVMLQSLDVPLERALAGDDPAAPAALQPAPQPRRAERVALDEGAIRAEIRAEIRALRGRLERLERLLEPADRRGR